MNFDLVHCILTDAEIEELTALCAKTVSDILADINDYDTLKAAKRWIRQCVTELYDMRNHRNEEEGYTFSNMVKFYYNHVKYDQRFRFQTDFYISVAKSVATRLLDIDDRTSEYPLLKMGAAISDALQSWYDAGRKIPKNQWWNEDFEVDRVLWKAMTSTSNILIQRDTPSPASRWIVAKPIVTNCIVSYMRHVLNACALCTTIEIWYGPNTDQSQFDDNLAQQAMLRCRDNLSRLLPKLIDQLNLVITFAEGGAL